MLLENRKTVCLVFFMSVANLHAAQQYITPQIQAPLESETFLNLNSPQVLEMLEELQKRQSQAPVEEIKFLDNAQPHRQITTIKAEEIEYFTKRTFSELIKRSVRENIPLVVARVEARHTVSSKPSTPSIEEEGVIPSRPSTPSKQERDDAYDPELIDIAFKAKAFRPTQHKTLHEFYEASYFNAYRYDDYPLTAQKIAHPESRDPKKRKYSIKGVEYYIFDPSTKAFVYQFSDVSLVGKNNQLFLVWLNAHQTIDPYTRALASAELGNMYAQGDGLKHSPEYLMYSYDQDEFRYAKALAAYYLGIMKYDQFSLKPENGTQKLLKEALDYFQEAYDEKHVSEFTKTLASKAAYYLGNIYNRKLRKEKNATLSNKYRKLAEEYLRAALQAPEFRQLAEDELAELGTAQSCCGFLNILKKKNKIAPE
jgi:hypothetical protein